MWTELYPGPANLEAPDSSCIKSGAMAFLLRLARDPGTVATVHTTSRAGEPRHCQWHCGSASGMPRRRPLALTAFKFERPISPFGPSPGHHTGSAGVCTIVYSPSITMFMRFPGVHTGYQRQCVGRS